MPARRSTVAAAIALAAVLAAYLAAAASCPPATGRDAAACDTPHQTDMTAALCASAAQKTETCADHATGIVRNADLARAASEWRKAAIATNRGTAQARRWLAHATVLDERVQDDPAAPAALRAQAKHNEQLARDALLRMR